MASRFVSGGTIAGDTATTTSETPTTTATATTTTTISQAPTNASTSAWEKAQAQLETDRRAREAARKAAIESSSGQSLYDILQANKAAKQAAFEEANKIRNQFRALDDDELDFLEGVAADERREEEQKRWEEEESLREFRNAQNKNQPAAKADDAGLTEQVQVDEWSTGAARKRKREKEPIIKGIKRRVSEPAKEDEDTHAITKKDVHSTVSANAPMTAPAKPVAEPPTTTAKPKTGLVMYDSDSDSDD